MAQQADTEYSPRGLAEYWVNLTPCQIRTIVYRRRVTGCLKGFENFGRIHYRIQEGGHLPYEG